MLLILLQGLCFTYLATFSGRHGALAGVLWLDVLLAYSLSYIQGPSIVESADILSAVIMTGALLALYRRQVGLLLVVLAVGTFNRETQWIILPAVFAWRQRSGESHVVSLAAAAAVAVPYLAVRFLIPAPGAWLTTGGLALNVPFFSAVHTPQAITATIHVLLLLGPLVALAAWRYRDHDPFLQVSGIIVVLFIIVHYLFGTVIESRLWIPLYPVLLPLSLGSIHRLLGAAK
jgi:hypothetical protein